MSIKKGNSRTMLTLSQEDREKLKIIMYDLKTRQISKAIHYLIEQYNYNKEIK